MLRSVNINIANNTPVNSSSRKQVQKHQTETAKRVTFEDVGGVEKPKQLAAFQKSNGSSSRHKLSEPTPKRLMKEGKATNNRMAEDDQLPDDFNLADLRSTYTGWAKREELVVVDSSVNT